MVVRKKAKKVKKLTAEQKLKAEVLDLQKGIALYRGETDRVMRDCRRERERADGAVRQLTQAHLLLDRVDFGASLMPPEDDLELATRLGAFLTIRASRG